MSDETISRISGREPEAAAAAGGPQLHVELECDRPAVRPSRHTLDGVHEVALVRGPRGARRVDAGGVRRLILSVPDGAMSGEHARLVRVRDRWILEDNESKNGTIVNGAPVTRAVLLDGDLVELGRTVLRWWASAAPAVPAVLDLDGGALPHGTFLAGLDAELAALARVASSAVPVTLVGETGTGKEVAARALHAASGRRGPFVAVNCGAIAPALVEATLFGHRKGAFSGAVEDRPGVVRSADRGTLLLDELGDLSPAGQTALLRVLQEREVTPVGDAVAVDFRVVAASHRPLAELAAAGELRRDLQARFTGLTVTLPPLRERRADLGLFISLFLGRAGARAIQVEAARALFRNEWPLNIRELEQSILAAAALAGDGPIRLEHLPPEARGERDAGAEDARLRAELTALLAAEKGNVAEVARAMGKGRMQIHRWMKRFGLDARAYRP